MQSIFGDRWYGELQWNNVPEQHELNQYIIQMHQEFGIELTPIMVETSNGVEIINS